MNNYEKGDLIAVDPLTWYIVVSFDNGYLRCICDNANNTYKWNPEEVKYTMTKYQVGMFVFNHYNVPEDLPRHLEERIDIASEVVLEVLCGVHDDRWGKK